MPHFNFTGRKKIRSKDVTILTFVKEGTLTFTVDLDLVAYNLPDKSALFIEAYRQSSWMRFALGTIETYNSENIYELSEFNESGGVLFRLKVTDMDAKKGLIIAMADKIQPLSEDGSTNGRDCILSVRPVDMSAIWRVDLDDVAYPVLCLNKDAGSKISLAHSWHFITMVYPALVREILTRVAENKVDDWIDTPDSWEYKWYSFARSVKGVYEMPYLYDGADAEIDNEAKREIREWVDTAVEAFAKDNNVLSNFKKLVMTED